MTAWLAEEEWVYDTPACVKVLAETEWRDGDLDAAISRLNEAFKRSKQDHEMASQLAGMLLGKSYRSWKAEPNLPWNTPSSYKHDLERAASLLKSVIKTHLQQGTPEQAVPDMSNRAVALMLLDRNLEALETLEEALGHKPDSPTLLLNIGWVYNKLKNTDKAITAFEKSIIGLTAENDNSARWEAIRGLAYAYFCADAWSKLSELLTPALGWNGKSFSTPDSNELNSDFFDLLGLWLTALQNLLENSSEQTTIDQYCTEKTAAVDWLKTEFPQHSDALAARADILWAEQRFLDSTRLRRQAIELASGARRDRLTLELAECLFHRHRYRAAIPLYRQVIKEDVVNTYLAHYAVALLRSGVGTEEAVRLAKQVRAISKSLKDRRGPAFAIFAEIEASASEFIGDWKTALLLRRELCEIEPERLDHKISLALMEYHSGDIASASTTLTAATPPDAKVYPELVMELAKARASLRLPGALELAYSVWRVSPHRADLQSLYISLFQQITSKDNPLYHPDQVRAECCVTLLVGSEESTRVITGQRSANETLLPTELLPTYPQARKLIGKRIGDKVELAETPMGVITAVITN